MAPSPFFARIKRDVLAILTAVPAGRVVTFADVGRHLEVMPRHVAYILSTLEPGEAARVPWHRAVPEDGRISRPKADRVGRTQTDLLAADGVEVDVEGRLVAFGQLVVPVADLPSGIPPQSRPPDAPAARSRRRR